jgi:hypothetical protein
MIWIKITRWKEYFKMYFSSKEGRMHIRPTQKFCKKKNAQVYFFLNTKFLYWSELRLPFFTTSFLKISFFSFLIYFICYFFYFIFLFYLFILFIFFILFYLLFILFYFTCFILFFFLFINYYHTISS